MITDVMYPDNIKMLMFSVSNTFMREALLHQEFLSNCMFLQIHLAFCCPHSEWGSYHISISHDVCPQCSLNHNSTLIRTASQAWFTESSDPWLLVVVQANRGVDVT